MCKKISKEQLIQAVENNELNRPDYELAASLGISPAYFSELKTEYKEDIRDRAKEMTAKFTMDMVNCLIFNAKNKYDTKAALAILEMASVYIPKQIHDIKGDITITIQKPKDLDLDE